MATNRLHENGNRSSLELEQDIQRTRSEMDETLEAIGDRLHPRHLLDNVLEMFRGSTSGSGSEVNRQARETGKQIVRSVKQHPVPTTLLGAGLAWLLYEELQDDTDTPRARQGWRGLREQSGSFVDARTGEPYKENYGREWVGPVWGDRFDWSQHHESKESWQQRAERTLNDLRTQVADKSLSTQQRLRAVAGKLMSLSGRKRSEIHTEWANLEAYGDSFADTRTGRPYHPDAAKECEDLYCCDTAAAHDWSEEEEKSWSEQANATLRSLQDSLNQTGASLGEQIRGATSHLSDFVRQTQGVTVRQGKSMQSGIQRTASRTSRGMQDGYQYTADRFRDALHESPLAVGGAVLGLGLLVGALLPRTRQEDEMMGEQSDRLKDEAAARGRDAVERGQRVAEKTGAAAMEEMERQGLTPEQALETARERTEHAAAAIAEETQGAEQIPEKLKKVADRTAETAQSEAKKEAKESTS